MILKPKEQACCAGPGCCGPTTSSTTTQSSAAPQAQNPEQPPKEILIDFLYLDLEVCTRCQGADTNLDEAIADVRHVLQAAGVSVKVNKVNINTEELAIQYQFVSSPTIRINGRDIAVDVKENLCESCGDLCGDSVDCRIWTWQGVDYTQPPKPMIINALLQAVYGAPAESNDKAVPSYQLPDNLRKFYDAMKKI